MEQTNLSPLAVSMGEPAGIGPDLLLQLYAQRESLDLPSFIAFGSLTFLRARAKRLQLDIELVATTPQDAQSQFATSLPVFNIIGDCPDLPGEPSPQSAEVVIGAIRAAVEATRSGACRAIVTAPIHKAQLYAAGFAHPGHTEYLAALCKGEQTYAPHPVMMLAHETYRVVPLTIHIPVKDVAEAITPDLIKTVCRVVSKDLQNRYGISQPKVALSGLNPHAGEDGTIGQEDRDIIAPTIEALNEEGLNIVGPLSADTLFHPPHWQSYDCVIAMYHDQALIPIKTLAFDQGVNVTLGLPIIRTSPDHGTAFDFAGTGNASSKSMLAAIQHANRVSRAKL